MIDINDIRERKVLLSTLWVFFILNIIYADIISLMEVTFTGFDVTTADNFELIKTILSPAMLLLVAIILELGMVMVVLSRVLKRALNRWANIVVAIIQAVVLLASLFVAGGTPKIYYLFFVTVEIIALLLIIWYAWTWPKPAVAKGE
jgi:heme A synthase